MKLLCLNLKAFARQLLYPNKFQILVQILYNFENVTNCNESFFFKEIRKLAFPVDNPEKMKMEEGFEKVRDRISRFKREKSTSFSRLNVRNIQPVSQK